MSGRAGLGHCPALGRPLGRGARGDGASRPCESLRLSAEQACLAPPLKTNHRADRIQRRSDFYLASVSLLLNATDPGDGGEYNLAVLADFSGSPGDPISDTAVSGVKLDSDLSTSLEVLTFFPRLLLSPNTRYWFGMSGSPSSSANWSYSSDISGIGVAGEF